MPRFSYELHHNCSNSPVDSAPRTEKDEQNLISVGAVHSADFHHRILEAVLSLTGDMAVVCAFSITKDGMQILLKNESTNT